MTNEKRGSRKKYQILTVLNPVAARAGPLPASRPTTTTAAKKGMSGKYGPRMGSRANLRPTAAATANTG
jgi:hypothetical protein